MPYLKILPDTYILTRQQMFKFDTCQFCGSHGEHNYKRLIGEDNNLWKRTCRDCSKTTALVKRSWSRSKGKKRGRPTNLSYAKVNLEAGNCDKHFKIESSQIKLLLLAKKPI